MSIFSAPDPGPVPQPTPPPTVADAQKKVYQSTVKRPQGSKDTILTSALGSEFERPRRTLGSGVGV